tara:strand:+ start:54 stop:338 length:285 start_codon:yes stop_codon:yes gene_type:complete
MGFTTFLFLLIGLLIEIIDSISYVISTYTDSFFPDYVYITLQSLQVFFPLLAIIFSLINCFTDKKSTKTSKFILLALSTSLFIANLNWLLTWFV